MSEFVSNFKMLYFLPIFMFSAPQKQEQIPQVQCKLHVSMASESSRFTTISPGCNIIQASQWYDMKYDGDAAAIYIDSDKSSIFMRCCYFETCRTLKHSDGAIHISARQMEIFCVAASECAAEYNMFGSLIAQKRYRISTRYLTIFNTGLRSKYNHGKSHGLVLSQASVVLEHGNFTNSQTSEISPMLSSNEIAGAILKFTSFVESSSKICLELSQCQAVKKFEFTNFVNLTASDAIITFSSNWKLYWTSFSNCHGLLFKHIDSGNLVITNFVIDFPISDFPGVNMDKKTETNSFAFTYTPSGKLLFNRYRWDLK